jgi:hypothetical protein
MSTRAFTHVYPNNWRSCPLLLQEFHYFGTPGSQVPGRGESIALTLIPQPLTCLLPTQGAASSRCSIPTKGQTLTGRTVFIGFLVGGRSGVVPFARKLLDPQGFWQWRLDLDFCISVSLPTPDDEFLWVRLLARNTIAYSTVGLNPSPISCLASYISFEVVELDCLGFLVGDVSNGLTKYLASSHQMQWTMQPSISAIALD